MTRLNTVSLNMRRRIEHVDYCQRFHVSSLGYHSKIRPQSYFLFDHFQSSLRPFNYLFRLMNKVPKK